jgi:hypothetical protein
MRNPFRYFNSSPEVIRLTVMLYIGYPLSLRQVEDLLFERGIDICHEGIDTLTPAVGRRAPDVGSGCEAALPPYSKRLGAKRLEDAARQEVALDVEGVLDGGVDCQEALG